MTHQPRIPKAATPPYPIRPEPIPEKEEMAADATIEERASPRSESIRPATVAAVGAAIGIGAAITASLVYARRSAAAKAPKQSGDDKRKRGAADRRRVAAGEAYEVSYFARKHGISAGDARAIIKKAGSDRDAANALAAAKKR